MKRRAASKPFYNETASAVKGGSWRKKYRAATLFEDSIFAHSTFLQIYGSAHLFCQHITKLGRLHVEACRVLPLAQCGNNAFWESVAMQRFLSPVLSHSYKPTEFSHAFAAFAQAATAFSDFAAPAP